MLGKLDTQMSFDDITWRERIPKKWSLQRLFAKVNHAHVTISRMVL